LNTQRAVGRLTPTRAIGAMSKAMANERFCAWAFERYLEIAPPRFATGGRPHLSGTAAVPVSAAA
jgi:hypothetical protein